MTDRGYLAAKTAPARQVFATLCNVAGPRRRVPTAGVLAQYRPGLGVITAQGD